MATTRKNSSPDQAKPAQPAAGIDPVNSAAPASDGVASATCHSADETGGSDRPGGVQEAGATEFLADDDGGRPVPAIPDKLVVPIDVSSKPGTTEYFQQLYDVNTRCCARAVSNRTEADVIDLQRLVIASLVGGPNSDYPSIVKAVKARGHTGLNENKPWLVRTWFTWPELRHPKDASTATRRAKSAEKLWAFVLHRQEARADPYAPHNEADVHELVQEVAAMGGFAGLRRWKPPEGDGGEEDANDAKQTKLDSEALFDERVRIGLGLVSDEEQTIKIGNRTVRNLDPSDPAHRELLSGLATGPAAVEVLGTALRLGVKCVNLDDKEARRHLLIRRDGTLLLTVQYQDAAVLVEVVPRPEVLPLLYPVTLPMAGELWAEARSRQKACNNVGEAERRPAFTLTPDFVNRGGKKTFLEWVLATKFGTDGPSKAFTVRLRDAYQWSLLSEHQKRSDEQRDKTPRDVTSGFTPAFTASVAPEAVAEHVKVADNLLRLAKKSVKDMVLRRGADLIEVRERNFNPALPLLPGSSGTMPDVRVRTVDWASVIQALAELRSAEPIQLEVDAERDMLRLTAGVPVAACRLWLPLLDHKGRSTKLIGKMRLGPAR